MSGRRIAPLAPTGGALYVVDYGKVQIAPEVGGIAWCSAPVLCGVYGGPAARTVRHRSHAPIPIYMLQYWLPALALGMVLLFGLIVRARQRPRDTKEARAHAPIAQSPPERMLPTARPARFIAQWGRPAYDEVQRGPAPVLGILPGRCRTATPAFWKHLARSVAYDHCRSPA